MPRTQSHTSSLPRWLPSNSARADHQAAPSNPGDQCAIPSDSEKVAEGLHVPAGELFADRPSQSSAAVPMTRWTPGDSRGEAGQESQRGLEQLVSLPRRRPHTRRRMRLIVIPTLSWATPRGQSATLAIYHSHSSRMRGKPHGRWAGSVKGCSAAGPLRAG